MISKRDQSFQPQRRALHLDPMCYATCPRREQQVPDVVASCEELKEGHANFGHVKKPVAAMSFLFDHMEVVRYDDDIFMRIST